MVKHEYLIHINLLLPAGITSLTTFHNGILQGSKYKALRYSESLVITKDD